MKSWANRKSLHRSIVTSMVNASSNTGNNNAKPPVLTDDLATWLAQLTLLYGVPTEYLAPDTRLLPLESIRFFYLDRNWLDRLVDGALSTGVLSSRDDVFNEVFFEQIYQQIDNFQIKLRSILRDEPQAAFDTTGGTISGFIFRSQVVSGWPGLEVNGYKGDTLLNILRMDRLSPNVLLCMFYDVPDRVDFIEPPEGLHFGISREIGASTFTVSLRGLGFPASKPYPAGEQIPDPNIPGAFLKVTGQLRGGAGQEPGVMDINNLVTAIKTGMPAGALDNGTLTPGGFAIQLTQGAGLQSYQVKDSHGASYPACTVTVSAN
jgi:hypothetical protein